MNAMAPVPADHPLMKAWVAYQETDDFKNTFKWATRAILISTQATAPEANRVDPEEARQQRAMGTLWGAFMAGFSRAGSWQPIATAPRDGNAVLLWWPEHKLDDEGNLTDKVIGGTHVIGNYIGSWQEFGGLEGRGAWFGDDSEPGHEPTLWQPLPLPPVT